jgi:hypothetical protein
MNISNVYEQDHQVLVDALKYTSDIVVSLTNKLSKNEEKIMTLEKELNDYKNKTDKKFIEFNKKISNFDKTSLLSSNNKILIENDNDLHSNFELLSQTCADINSNGDIIDYETFTNTLCNTTMMSEATSNLDDFKKDKATTIVQNLIKQKLELEKKINGLVDNNIVENNTNTNKINNDNEDDQIIASKNLNAIRKKKNFARRF